MAHAGRSVGFPGMPGMTGMVSGEALQNGNHVLPLAINLIRAESITGIPVIPGCLLSRCGRTALVGDERRARSKIRDTVPGLVPNATCALPISNTHHVVFSDALPTEGIEQTHVTY